MLLTFVDAGFGLVFGVEAGTNCDGCLGSVVFCRICYNAVCICFNVDYGGGSICPIRGNVGSLDRICAYGGAGAGGTGAGAGAGAGAGTDADADADADAGFCSWLGPITLVV